MADPNSNVVQLNPSTLPTPLIGEVNTHLINLAQSHLSPALESSFTHILSHITELSEAAGSNTQILQWMELTTHLKQARESILSEFQKNLMAHFESWEDTESKDAQDLNSELSLVDNNDLEQRLAWQAAAKQLGLGDSAQYLNQMESRLSHLTNVQTEMNPLGPCKICESFALAVQKIPMELDVYQSLILQFAIQIKPVVHDLWKAADQYLESKGLKISKPATCIADIPEQTPFSTEETINTLPFTELAPHQHFSPDVVDDSLMEAIAQKVVSRMEGLLTAQPINASASESGTIEVKAFATADLTTTLTAIQNELVGQHACMFSLSESIQDALKNRGIKQKLSPRHNDLINMIGMLFEFILDDHELPEEVKRLIGLLQIPVLKLALLDNNFLTSRDHPARELLNAMTSAGMHTVQQPASEKPVIELIEKTVKGIIKGFSQDQEIFISSLKSFKEELQEIQKQALLDEQENAESTENNTTDQPPESEETHQAVFDPVFEAITSITAQYSIPEPLTPLINEAWPEVLASLEEDSIKYFQALNTLDMLLWSLQPEHFHASDQDDWLTLKNLVLDQLNDIDYNPFVVVEWMNALNTIISQPVELPREPVTLTINNAEQQTDNVEEIILESDLSQSMDIDAIEVEPGNFEIIDSSDEEEAQVDTLHQQGIQLILGQWVEFIGNNEHLLRCKLASIDATSNRYIFVNSSGMKVAEQSGQELKKLLEEGRLRIVEDTQFFDKALHAVMDKFLKF